MSVYLTGVSYRRVPYRRVLSLTLNTDRMQPYIFAAFGGRWHFSFWR
jgi:hypothetical protein